MRLSARTLIAAVPTLLIGCPADVEPHQSVRSRKEPDATDPRVEEVRGDLYPKEQAAKLRENLVPPAARTDGKPRGVGLPDESNGKCRLFTPQGEEPQCCSQDLGFDPKLAVAHCGLGTYLGESFHYTCGHYFAKDTAAAGTSSTWMRVSEMEGLTPKTAAERHDRKLQVTYNDPSLRSTPIPGVPGGFWSSKDGLNWAFIPGWTHARQLAWHDDACDRGGMAKVLRAWRAVPERKKTGAKPQGPQPGRARG